MLGAGISGMLGVAESDGIGAGKILGGIGDIIGPLEIIEGIGGGGIDSRAGDWASASPANIKKPTTQPARFRPDNMIAPRIFQKT